MSDWDINQIADAYLVDLDDRPLDDDRYDPLAADTADPCPRCLNQRYVNTPAGYIAGVPAYRQEPCPDCNGETS